MNNKKDPNKNVICNDDSNLISKTSGINQNNDFNFPEPSNCKKFIYKPVTCIVNAPGIIEKNNNHKIFKNSCYIYNKYYQKIENMEYIKFKYNGIMTDGISHNDNESNIIIENEGIYAIWFTIGSKEKNKFILCLNDISINGSDYYFQPYQNNEATNIQCINNPGFALINVKNCNSNLKVKNISGKTVELYYDDKNGNSPVNSSLMIIQL